MAGTRLIRQCDAVTNRMLTAIAKNGLVIKLKPNVAHAVQVIKSQETM
jgi:hypothetical protein